MASKKRGEGTSPQRRRIAVIGGGCAGLAATWQLSKMPGYDVHVFERSPRLGGKGASVRDKRGRIHEHGLHVWLGFYENAFRMMRECYAEVRDRGWGPEQRSAQKRLAHGSFEDAFLPEPHIGVAVDDRAGGWEVWSGHLPPMKGLPGDPIDAATNPFTLANYLLRCLELVKALMLSVVEPVKGRVPGAPADARSSLDEERDLDFTFDPVRSPRALVERMARMLRAGVLTTAAGVLQGVTILEDWLRTLNFAPQVSGTVLEFLEALTAQTRKQLRDFVAIDPRLRSKTEIIDIVMTIAVGLYRDKVLFGRDGLDAINGIDYRKWLAKHGATKSSVESPFLTGIYDLVFAYRDGDRKRPALAAGVALRGALRMFFTYRGAMFWRMRSGMGDAVFAPLYKVLSAGRTEDEAKPNLPARAKVAFHFGHKLTGIKFDLDAARGRRVTGLRFEVSAAASNKAVLDHFGCWPEADRSSTRTKSLELKADEDFDAVIFALGIDDFVRACGDETSGPAKSAFFKALPEWDSMRRRVRTTPTKVAQVWFEADAQALGWTRAPGLITALGPPFDTWANMTHTLPSESAWRRTGEKEPAPTEKAVAYLCGTLSDHEVRSVESSFAREDDEDQNVETVREKLKLRIGAELERVFPDLTPDQTEHALANLIIETMKESKGKWGKETAVLQRERDRRELAELLAAALARKLGSVSEKEVQAALDQLIEASLTAIGSSYADVLTADRQPDPEEVARRIAADVTARLAESDWRKSALYELFGEPVKRALTICQANFVGSERYTLALPGSIRHRVSPLDRSVLNMTIAGDWTACGLDAGCVEAAVMSGMLAVHAITGKEPGLDEIVGYHHP